jgi:integrase
MRFFEVLNIDDPNCHPFHLVIFCAMLIAFFAFLRKGNIASKTSTWDDDTHALSRDDIFIHWPTYTLWLRIRRTKTIQFDERLLWVPIKGQRGHPLDVVALFSRMCDAIPATATDHAFTTPSGRPLTHDEFVDWTKHLVRNIGLDPSQVSGHSFRRGGASFALYSGVPDAFIKLIGDWRSNAYLAYLIIPTHSRSLVSHCMLSKIVEGDLGRAIFGGVTSVH